ncbi:MAG: hypothetical protein R3F27_00415 [Gammaproteobacteria bacterium]
MRNFSLKRAIAIAALASGLSSFSALSAELDWSIESTVGRTDNATRVDTDEISDTIGSIGGHIDLRREGSRINGRLRGHGSYRDYFDDTYDSEFLGSGAAELRIGLIGEVLTWSIDDTFGQVLSDSLAPSTPENRENVNIFSTGPDLRLPLGRATDLVIGARYQDASYQDSNNVDNNRVTADIALIRRTSPAVTWSLNVNASSVDFDGPNNPGYDQQEVFVRLESKGAKQTLTADLGASFLDGGDQTDQTALMRLNWLRQLSSSWSLELEAGSEFENADDQFAYGVAGGTNLGGTQDVLLSGQAMRNDTAALSLRFMRPRTRLRLHGDVGNETYPDAVDLDRDNWSLGAEVTRRLTARLEATLAFDHEERNYDVDNSSDETDRYSARIDWRIGRAVFLGIEGRWEDRSGNTGFTYDETVYLASISYRPGAP